MEHIRQYDWYPSTPDIHFVDECDLDNCVTEKILRNKFYDPLVSSDSENEAPNKIDWDDLFKEAKHVQSKFTRTFVPGLRGVAPYPKISSFTPYQHMQCLKVLCSQNPHILETEFFPRPTKQDYRVFEELKEKYIIEQKEYIEWAKSLWVNNHCIRALRPKPAVEMVYEAEFKIRAQRLQAFPKNYQMAAQIPLEMTGSQCELVHVQDLISVNIAELPHIELPVMIEKKVTIVRPMPMPEPCNKHPCRFVLPSEGGPSVLPLAELLRELAQLGAERGARAVCGEGALRCLLQRQRPWLLPLSVCQAIGPDGEKVNVIVLGSEFSLHRESAPLRTYKAFRHLLEYALIPASEKVKIRDRGNAVTVADPATKNKINDSVDSRMAEPDSSDEEENSLFIDADCDSQDNDKQIDNATRTEVNQVDSNAGERKKNGKEKKLDNSKNTSDEQVSGVIDDIGVYTCTCAESVKPPPRSFKKWQVKNNTSNESYDVIIHCAHRVRDTSGEVILEPIPEYQLELGGSEQSVDTINGLALALLLRRNASLLNVRVDGPSGDVVTFERVPVRDGESNPALRDASRASQALYCALDHLQGLLPGDYLLQHEPSHGANALLYAVSRGQSQGPSQSLRLQFDCGALSDADEAATVKAAPTIAPVLLPYHKFRKLAPCAFSPFAAPPGRAAKPPRPKTRTPPQALRCEAVAGSGETRKWPKKKQRKRKKNNPSN